ncbi:hypothetical protein R3P38DRAFT_2558915 [Favolaschia claudopus]|uniref:Uncharacterized protein n=1 Tax=Favolaschia claudopus TaxID=2862362 RepID=A0AAW0A6W4_9AGAR
MTTGKACIRVLPFPSEAITRSPIPTQVLSSTAPTSTPSNPLELGPDTEQTVSVHQPGTKLYSDFLAFKSSDFQPEAETDHRLISPWLKRTHWMRLIESHLDHLDELCNFAKFPGEEEFPELKTIVVTYFTAATQLVDLTHGAVLERLNTADPDKDGITNKPLHAHKPGDATFNKYVQIVIRLLGTFIRESKHYTLPFTPSCESSRAAFVHALNNGSDSDRDESLHNFLLSVWATTWQATHEERDCDPTLCFLGLYALQPTGEFLGPKQMTSPIAHLSWAIRLVILRQIHQLCASGVCKDHLDAFNQVAEYITEHNINTFSSLRSLQHYATAVTMSTMPLPSIVFLDREAWTAMYFKGQHFSLEKLRKILAALEVEIMRLWTEKVMLGLNLRVDYTNLVDNLQNQKPGYSFIQEPTNPFVQHKNTFLQTLLADPVKAREFVFKAAGVEDEQIDMTRCRGYMTDVGQFEGLLMLYVELTPSYGNGELGTQFLQKGPRTRGIRGNNDSVGGNRGQLRKMPPKSREFGATAGIGSNTNSARILGQETNTQ